MRTFPNKTPSAVILDMDGTTVRHLNERWINLAEWLDDRAHILGECFSSLFKRKAIDPKEILERIQSGVPHKKPRLYGHRALHTLRRTRGKDVDQIVEPSPHVETLLNTLAELNIPVGLASNGLGKGYGHEVLDTFKLTDFFKATVFREDIQKSKPNPESILLTLKRMDLDLNEGDIVWFVGDRSKDIKAAVAADKLLPFTVVPIAYTPLAGLQVYKEGLTPDHIITSYDVMDKKLKTMIQP